MRNPFRRRRPAPESRQFLLRPPPFDRAWHACSYRQERERARAAHLRTLAASVFSMVPDYERFTALAREVDESRDAHIADVLDKDEECADMHPYDSRHDSCAPTRGELDAVAISLGAALRDWVKTTPAWRAELLQREADRLVTRRRADGEELAHAHASRRGAMVAELVGELVQGPQVVLEYSGVLRTWWFDATFRISPELVVLPRALALTCGSTGDAAVLPSGFTDRHVEALAAVTSAGGGASLADLVEAVLVLN